MVGLVSESGLSTMMVVGGPGLQDNGEAGRLPAPGGITESAAMAGARSRSPVTSSFTPRTSLRHCSGG